VDDDRLQRTRDQIERLARSRLDWVTFAREVTDTIRRSIEFDRCCWHTVDPGTMLLTGSVNRNVGCSGSWLAEYEYVIEDVNKWWFLARSGQIAGATSLATHGDLARSARHRSHAGSGIGDELRGSFVAGGTYWGAAGLLRDEDRPWFTEDDVRLLTSLADAIAAGMRAALVNTAVASSDVIVAAEGPGVVVFDEAGRPELISPAAEQWIAELVEDPRPDTPSESKVVQAVAVRARALGRDNDPLELAARSRVQTRSGAWLTLYGTPLAGGSPGRMAVIIQPAAPNEVAPLVALAYGLTDREGQVVRLCMQGRSTKQMAKELDVSPYTSTRNELVGQIFLEHYCPRWEDVDDTPPGWTARAMPTPA
jgi:hypothetical protein